jgi:hypothetical protein
MPPLVEICHFPFGSGLGQPEIQDLYSIPRQHDVGWLDVAVRDAGPVGAVQGVSDLGGGLHGLIEREGALGKARRQSLAFQALHHHATGAIQIADVVEHADIGMVQSRHGPRLALKPLAEVIAPGDMPGQDLDSDKALEARVASLLYFAHAPGSERGKNLVGSKHLPAAQRHDGYFSSRSFTVIMGCFLFCQLTAQGAGEWNNHTCSGVH